MEGERIGIPRIGDVIACAAFENGWRHPQEPEQPVWVTDDPLIKVNPHAMTISRDATRETARFVVEESFRADHSVSWTERRRAGYGGIHEWDEDCRGYAQRVVARRLADDGSYDPSGQTIRFDIWGHGAGELRSRSVCEVLQERHDDYRRYAIMGAPIYKLRTMERIVRFA